MNVDLFARQITFGGPSTDWWAQLASAVAGGLTFATLLTLVLTPALLLLGAGASSWAAARRARRGDAVAGDRRAAPSAARRVGFGGNPLAMISLTWLEVYNQGARSWLPIRP